MKHDAQSGSETSLRAASGSRGTHAAGTLIPAHLNSVGVQLHTPVSPRRSRWLRLKGNVTDWALCDSRLTTIRFGVAAALAAGVVAMLLVMAGVERNPGPPRDRPATPPPSTDVSKRFCEQHRLHSALQTPYLSETWRGKILEEATSMTAQGMSLLRNRTEPAEIIRRLPISSFDSLRDLAETIAADGGNPVHQQLLINIVTAIEDSVYEWLDTAIPPGLRAWHFAPQGQWFEVLWTETADDGGTTDGRYLGQLGQHRDGKRAANYFYQMVDGVWLRFKESSDRDTLFCYALTWPPAPNITVTEARYIAEVPADVVAASAPHRKQAKRPA
ncbi:MAG: hypothetical protein AABY90_02600, partial [Nitrospirota bacterium]